jgi:hypothetical protein
MTCWVNGDKCPYRFEGLKDSNLSYCKECENFNRNDLVDEMKSIGFISSNHLEFFLTEEFKKHCSFILDLLKKEIFKNTNQLKREKKLIFQFLEQGFFQTTNDEIFDALDRASFKNEAVKKIQSICRMRCIFRNILKDKS